MVRNGESDENYKNWMVVWKRLIRDKLSISRGEEKC